LKLKLILFFVTVSLFFSIFSCASSDEKSEKTKAESDPEIGEATMKGGERVAVRGYSQDKEMNKKMKQLDLEIVDCYKQFTPIGNASEMTINYNIIIDESGFVEKAAYKKGNTVLNKIAECIANDMKELPFRPGELRELDYRLVFKPLKQKKKANPDDKRSKMMLSLSEMKKFRTCYEESSAKTPGLSGNFSIKFIVTEEGRAEDMKITGNTFPDSSVPLCVVKKLSETVFPEGESEDVVEVNFKYVSANPPKGRKSMDIDM
jgi:hypothetical protein